MKKRKRRKTKSNNDTNPLLWTQTEYLNTLSEKERNQYFSSSLSSDRRAEIWMQQADLGESLVNQYSWATPDDRALNILKHFSPIIEIGCGSNAYWCRCMKDHGIDVEGYDTNIDAGGQITSNGTKDRSKGHNGIQGSFHAQMGGPEVLSSARVKNENRTLFLCYPDENDEPAAHGHEPSSMGAICLEHYTGQYVIHVGELYGDTISLDQAPWGRSSASEFQQRLAAEFHCLLKARLTSWLHVRDSISVWKRSETCTIVFEAEDENDEDEEVEYAHIPVEERLPVDVAAPCVQHLLEAGNVVSNHVPIQVKDRSAITEAQSQAVGVGENNMQPKQGDKKKGKKSKREGTENEDSPPTYSCPW